MTTTILLADDHAILREGLGAILAGQADLKVVGQAATGREAVEMAARLCPDVILMDIAMPDLNGVDATRRILAADPKVKVIALSAYTDRQYVLAMLQAGACGYLVKASAGEELLRAVRAVVAGRKFLCPEAADTAVDSCTGRLFPQQGSVREILTPREVEILQRLAEGRTSAEIAKGLDIAEGTVNVHRKNISRKLNLRTVAELTKYAVRQGLTSG
jgi:DNA-binding NarL/FixJ family response regulator